MFISVNPDPCCIQVQSAAGIETVPEVNACVVDGDTSSIIISPNYPDNYGDFTICKWLIVGKSDSVNCVHITLKDRMLC